jgi:predicted Zn-dependent peptidase
MPELDKDKLVALAEQCAEVIENGWMQGWYVHTDGEGNNRYCSLGAINHVTGEWDSSVSRGSVREKLRIAAAREIDPSFDTDLYDPHATVVQWNDESGRTQAEVADLFRKVAKNIANGEQDDSLVLTNESEGKTCAASLPTLRKVRHGNN